MTMSWELASKLFFPIITAIVVAAIGKRLEYKPKLIVYLAHAAGFYLPPVEGPAQPSSAPAGASPAEVTPTPASAAPIAPSPPATGVALGAPAVQLHVHGIIVRNTGKKTAFNVRIGHNARVQHYVLEPQIQHEKKEALAGGWEIVIPTLVPNEQVMVSYLYFPPVTWHQINTYTKSDEGAARALNVLPTPRPPRWLVTSFLVFFYLGVIGSVYALISVAQWCLTVSQVVLAH